MYPSTPARLAIRPDLLLIGCAIPASSSLTAIYSALPWFDDMAVLIRTPVVRRFTFAPITFAISGRTNNSATQ